MNSKQLYFGFIGLLILLSLGTVVATYFANGWLEQQARQLTDLKATSQATADQQTALANDKKDLAKYSALNKIAQSIVPQDKDQAEAVREIVNIAAQSGIPSLSSITFQTSALGTKTLSTSNGLTQVTPVKGMPGVYDLQITVNLDASKSVPYSTFIKFLSKLEQNRRTAQVSSIVVQPDANNPGRVSFTLVIDEFLKP